MAKGGGSKKRFQYCTDSSGQELFLSPRSSRSFRTQVQDNMLIPNNFFEYIYHVGCAINLHSITNSGLIPGGQKLGKERQTVFFTAVNPVNKEHKDPYEIDLNAPRLAWFKQKKWKNTKTMCIGSKNNLLNRKDLSSMSPRPPPKNLTKTINWMCNLDSDVAGSSKDKQRIQPNPKTQ